MGIKAILNTAKDKINGATQKTAGEVSKLISTDENKLHTMRTMHFKANESSGGTIEVEQYLQIEANRKGRVSRLESKDEMKNSLFSIKTTKGDVLINIDHSSGKIDILDREREQKIKFPPTREEQTEINRIKENIRAVVDMNNKPENKLDFDKAPSKERTELWNKLATQDEKDALMKPFAEAMLKLVIPTGYK